MTLALTSGFLGCQKCHHKWWGIRPLPKISGEIFEHEELILKKTGRTRENFIEIMHCLKEVMTIITEEETAHLLGHAKLSSPDEKDVMYFALAMKLNCGIWSNDKRLKDQDSITIYSTQEVIEILKSK